MVNPNNKTFESIFEPHYAVNKMWGWFVHKCSNANDRKNDSPIINQLMFHYGCFRFMKYCMLLRTYLCAIIVQFEIKWKRVLIVFLLTHEKWDFLDWHFSNYGPNLVLLDGECYSPSKTSRLLDVYCTIGLSFKIGAMWSNCRAGFYNQMCARAGWSAPLRICNPRLTLIANMSDFDAKNYY